MSAHRGKFVAYFRVSTDKQGKSGLGLDAQRQAVLQFLDGGSWSLIGEFTEIESGKRNERPELEKALAVCKRHKAKLVIAKTQASNSLRWTIRMQTNSRFTSWPPSRSMSGK